MCLFLLNSYSQVKQENPLRPNIIIMLADDLGYDDLSCYRNQNDIQSENAPSSQTPFIDNLAKEGMCFTNFYSGAAVCSPSRAALLTGRNATRLGIYNFIAPGVPMHLENEEITIAELLKQKKYATAHFGKWHLTSENTNQPQPLDQGFDYAFWTYNTSKPSHKNPVNYIKNRDDVGELKGYSSHLVVGEAINWLEKNKANKTPFYMNIWFNEPHEKVAAPDSLKIRHKNNKDYYGCIENMDYAVGKLMKYLKENELDENTIIIYTSDNGSKYEGSNIPLRGEKCFQYEGGIRVPFIAFWKGMFPAGIKSDVVGNFTDVLPTLASLTKTQVRQDRTIDGENLSNVLLGKTKEYQRKEPIFFYRYFHDPICMLREGNMVLLGYQEKPKPWQVNYNAAEEALFQPNEGEPKGSQWRFQKNHMDAINIQEPRYFELYNVETDLRQHTNIALGNAVLLDKMKKMMLKKREEMVEEGGNWYKTN